MPEMEHRAYGYKHANANPAHAYLLPAVFAALDEAFGGRRVRLLDLGCGNGYVTSRLAERGYDVVGVDVSEDGLIQARAAHPHLEFRVGTVYDEDLPAKVGKDFDGVVTLEVIEHLFYPKRIFEQSRALLRPGGALVLSTPYHGYFKNLAVSLTNGWDRHWGVDWDGGHIKFFSEKTLRTMAEKAGFRDVRMRGVGRLPKLWKAMVMSARG